MRPFNSPRWIALLTVACVSVLQAKEAFTSGGGEITQTNEFVQVSFATARKIPMRGDEGRYAKSINEWEKATAPIAVSRPIYQLQRKSRGANSAKQSASARIFHRCAGGGTSNRGPDAATAAPVDGLLANTRSERRNHITASLAAT